MNEHLAGCDRCALERRRLAGLPALLDSAQADDTVALLSPQLEDAVLDQFVKERARPARPPRRWRRVRDSRNRRRGGDSRGGTGAGAPRRRSECLRPRRALEHLRQGARERDRGRGGQRHPGAAARPRPSGKRRGGTSSGAYARTAAGSTAEASTRAPTARAAAAHGSGSAGRVPRGRCHAALGRRRARRRGHARQAHLLNLLRAACVHPAMRLLSLTALLCSLGSWLPDVAVTTTAPAAAAAPAPTRQRPSSPVAWRWRCGADAQDQRRSRRRAQVRQELTDRQGGKVTIVMDNPSSCRTPWRSRGTASRRRATPSKRAACRRPPQP